MLMHYTLPTMFALLLAAILLLSQLSAESSRYTSQTRIEIDLTVIGISFAIGFAIVIVVLQAIIWVSYSSVPVLASLFFTLFCMLGILSCTLPCIFAAAAVNRLGSKLRPGYFLRQTLGIFLLLWFAFMASQQEFLYASRTYNTYVWCGYSMGFLDAAVVGLLAALATVIVATAFVLYCTEDSPLHR